MSWHLTHDQLHRYATHTADDVTAMSAEAHLTHCSHCRDRLPTDEAWLERSWADLRDIVDRPRPSPLERLLTALGLREHTATLLAATPTLYRAWLAATVIVLAATLALAHEIPRGTLLFACTAPVVPLVGVALAYGRGVDPAHSLASVTPWAGPRLLLLRTCAVLAPALTLCTIAALLMPAVTTVHETVFWLLPALAMVAGCLALGRWMHLSMAGGVIGGGWLLLLTVCTLLDGTDPLQVFSPLAQAGWATALALLAAVIALRVRTA
ncbi:zf-HC2 domain-containing protein [Nocardiopsis sp. MG754419]|uniref:zf-HC2 domain-containing protein n=1 Tax=Nocardiopsis sp. MG754419 TaxID=2259865 RepID=UPI001BABA8B2|nr:zf-HC2 domain-containing protein [Nocardiopsis sp. MG754419]MBR8741754.1 zf-HC2 domain-containing protein [Nocardiopsis sp. MG754419]